MNRRKLAQVARGQANKCFHGSLMGLSSNLDPVIQYFSGWTKDQWDNKWCAAFVYHCLKTAGYDLPVRYDHAEVTCNFAGCLAWEQWAKLPEHQCYYEGWLGISPGDIILYDRVFCDHAHDHIGIVLSVDVHDLEVAEGNLNNVSGIVRRPKNHHIRGYIRLEDKEEHYVVDI